MTDRARALALLLAQPDPTDLVGRGYRYVLPSPLTEAQRWVKKRDVARSWLAWRLYEAGKHESEVVSVRRTRLQLVRRRA